MILDVNFIQFLIDDYSKETIKIFVFDKYNTLIASTWYSDLDKYLNLAKYSINNNKPIVVEDIDIKLANSSIFALPFSSSNKIEGTIIIEGEKEEISTIGYALKQSFESIMLYNNYNNIYNEDKGNDKYKVLVDLLLDETFQEEKIQSLMNKLEIDTSLMFSVICIDYIFEKANYFNININLGYQSEIINTKEKIDQCLKSIKYLTTQDIVVRRGQNSSIIIKSYLPASDLNEIYLANQKICNEINEELSKIVPLEFHIASGDVYSNIKEIKNSYFEAKTILKIAKQYNKDDKVLNLKSILLEDTFHYLDSHIINRLINTNIKKIEESELNIDEFIHLIDIFIDCNFNIAKTANISQLHRNTIKNKLEKLKHITELDPSNSFSDAFLLKMIAIHYKQTKK
ncbi:MAG: helix-turn-helix domain-containing protein [Sphaerochaetaceae bacterium]|nr:helix-turn-helix domain-containing protein [Sphaerochaetaceae bacterium]